MTASLDAAEACFGAFLTMLGLMFLAFVPAFLANSGAESANLFGKLAAARHKRSCKDT